MRDDEIPACTARHRALDEGRVVLTDADVEAMTRGEDLGNAPARAMARELLMLRRAKREAEPQVLGIEGREVRLRLGQEQARAFAAAYLELLRTDTSGEWSNFLEMEMRGPAVLEHGFDCLTVTVQRHPGLTPAQKLRAAEAERDDLRAINATLIEDQCALIRAYRADAREAAAESTALLDRVEAWLAHAIVRSTDDV